LAGFFCSNISNFRLIKDIVKMRRIIISLLVFSFTAVLWAQPLPVKLHQTIIIDTDGAIDDMRAISLLLVRPEITVKAIITSDGSLPPEESVKNIRNLLHEFHQDNIPVAYGDVLKDVNPVWRQFNRQINWGSKINKQVKKITSVECLSEQISIADEKITLVCLGPLTNIAKVIKKEPVLLPKIERVVWYNESVKPLQGFNWECDRDNIDKVFQSDIRIDVISNLNKEGALFDLSMYEVCKQSKTQLANVLYNVHSQPVVFEKLEENHFRLWDDLVAIYITNPELFDISTMMNKVNVRYNQDYNLEGVKEAIGDMIKGTYVSEHNVVFNRFPDQREMFNYDVRPIIDSAIARYGYDEWKAIVMTDEFHGHLGIFSIVGAKMGIKAREFFGVGTDEMEVITYAGSEPPYSCLNDGIQVSTGATLGMGTIHLASDSINRPSALFTYNNRSILISLKKEYLEKVDADIKEGIVRFGLMDDGYWKLVRRNAIKYWLEWDRDKIFDLVQTDQ
jgi:inosine-uridine nucleoside N-ribohydrolase/formylmethanofuran dehydrogenase subunit E